MTFRDDSDSLGSPRVRLRACVYPERYPILRGARWGTAIARRVPSMNREYLVLSRFPCSVLAISAANNHGRIIATTLIEIRASAMKQEKSVPATLPLRSSRFLTFDRLLACRSAASRPFVLPLIEAVRENSPLGYPIKKLSG